MQYPIEKYKAHARQTFQTSPLIDNFSTWTNSWQIGNVFDTLTDYLVRFPDAEKAPGTIARIALDRWTKAAGSLCWYDDYGWWGIASEKAFHAEYDGVFGPTRESFQTIARQCWDVMNTGKTGKAYSYKGGPNVWENRENGSPTGYFTSPDTWAVPRFAGGVWQYDMFRERRPSGECSPSDFNPSDPNSTVLGPFQLTVMNGLYLVLAARLGANGQGTGDAVRKEFNFLKSWFYVDQEPGNVGQESLLMHFPPLALVRERVRTYAYCDATGSYPLVRGYNAGSAWCGDQGLILGGLLDYFRIDPAGPVAQPLAISIAGGVLYHMVSNQVVQPTLDLVNDPDDYGCGSGVFWRYLLYGFRTNAALRQQLVNWVTTDRANNAIYRSAEYACANGGPGNALFADFNVLATLTAAIEILQAAEA